MLSVLPLSICYRWGKQINKAVKITSEVSAKYRKQRPKDFFKEHRTHKIWPRSHPTTPMLSVLAYSHHFLIFALF